MIIDVDYRVALRQAARLEEAAAELERLAGRTEEAMHTADRTWEGEPATAYLRKGARLKNGMDARARDLRSMAEEIREVVEELQRLEAMNMGLAGTR